MHPACEICRGACCESIILPSPIDEVAREWLAARGRVNLNGNIELEQRCKMLTKDGLCGCQENKPRACTEYPVGSAGCRAAVFSRRTAIAREILSLMDQ